jgi:hypothetical protein
MATKKAKPGKAAGKVKVRQLDTTQTTLQQLIDEKKGLFIPLHQLSATELEALEAFLGNIKTEPVAMSVAMGVAVAVAVAVAEDVASAQDDKSE